MAKQNDDRPDLDDEPASPGNPWGGAGRPRPRPVGGQDRDGGGDLEDMLRRMQSRLRRPGPGGGQGRQLKSPFSGRRLPLLGAFVLAAWASSGVYVVNEGEQGVITRFGAFQSAVGPGLGVHLPAPFEDIRVVKTSTVRRELIGEREGQPVPEESLMLTADQSIVDIGFVVLWQVKDVRDFVFKVEGVENLVRAVAESAMREVVGRRDLDAIITTERAMVEAETRELMQRTLDGYESGVSINNVQLQSAKAPPAVTDAFNKVLEAEQTAEASINQANKFRNTEVPSARADAQRLLAQAQGYRDATVRQAAGEAARFSSLYEEYRLNPRVTRDRLYIETMERVYGQANKVVVDGKGAALPYLPLDRLFEQGARRSGAAAPAQPEGARQ
jgi:membrane protease subunit HflK